MQHDNDFILCNSRLLTVLSLHPEPSPAHRLLWMRQSCKTVKPCRTYWQLSYWFSTQLKSHWFSVKVGKDQTTRRTPHPSTPVKSSRKCPILNPPNFSSVNETWMCALALQAGWASVCAHSHITFRPIHQSSTLQLQDLIKSRQRGRKIFHSHILVSVMSQTHSLHSQVYCSHRWFQATAQQQLKLYHRIAHPCNHPP